LSQLILRSSKCSLRDGVSFGMPNLRPVFGTCCLVFCGLCFPAGFDGQSAPNPSPASDSKSTLLEAAAVNGAPGASAKPWHAKISFTLYDWDGKPEVQGTVEEFWAAPDKVKVVYSTSVFNQVEYTTAAGIRRTGSPDSAPPEITRIVDQFLHPIRLDQNTIEAVNLQTHELKLGAIKLACVTATSKNPSNLDEALNTTYCLRDSAPVLRLTLRGFNGYQRTSFNSIVKFQDRYFPQTVDRQLADPGGRSGRAQLTAKLETLEFMDPADDARFTPPNGATPPPQIITLDEGATKPQLQQQTAPLYPPIARAAHVSGDVVISLQIQTDGHVSDLRVLRGPPMLQQSALDAVKKWAYKPFEQNGRRVEVNTVATVRFRLGA
jgi:TonB family protein